MKEISAKIKKMKTSEEGNTELKEARELLRVSMEAQEAAHEEVTAAAQAAQEKAEAVAKTLGVTVKKPMTINTENYSVFRWSGSSQRGQHRMMQNAIQESGSGDASQGGGLAIGQINVSATVRVTYEIE